MNPIRYCYCYNCGHPVMAEGVAIDEEDDTDRTGAERDRCADTARESRAVATYQDGVLVVAAEVRS